jgi:hypothetical protein
MRAKVVCLSAAVLLAGVSTAQAQGLSREESLKGTHTLLMQAVKSANVAMITSIVHPQAIGFFRESQRPVELKPGVAVGDVVPAILTDLSFFTLTQYETTIRQFGDMGLVVLTSYADSSKKADRFLRSTYVYVMAGDAWKLLSWHTSDTPVKR